MARAEARAASPGLRNAQRPAPSALPTPAPGALPRLPTPLLGGWRLLDRPDVRACIRSILACSVERALSIGLRRAPNGLEQAVERCIERAIDPLLAHPRKR